MTCKISSLREACECGVYGSIVAVGFHRGIKWHTHKSPFYGVNGYMRIPAGHPWSDLSYQEINRHVSDSDTERFDGGSWELTFKGGAWIGFDTQHAWDSWPDMPFPWGPGGTEPYDTRWTPELVAVNARRWCDLIADETSITTELP